MRLVWDILMNTDRNASRLYPVIGITGPIASGKSEVLKILESHGFCGIDADKVGHQVLENDQECIETLIKAFGKGITKQGQAGRNVIDRGKLGKLVFSDSEKLSLLDKITHPRISEVIRGLINKAGKPVAIEAIKLMQTETKDLCDAVWLVESSEAVRIERLMTSRGFSEAMACERIRSQRDIVWNHAEFDAVINGDQPLLTVQREVESLLTAFEADFYEGFSDP